MHCRRRNVLAFLLFLSASVHAQTGSAPVSSATLPDFETERQQANDLFLAGKALQALPLYEDLEKRDPTHAVFVERHAAGLIAKSATVSDPAQESALLQEAYRELLHAQSLGDHSPYVEVQISNLKGRLAAKADSASETGGKQWRVAALLREGEAAFAKNEYPAALKAYTAAAAEDPGSYQAALFAGDVEFRLHNTDQAGQWFAKAIAIDPNIETAYRYWGDALMAANQSEEAREKFIDAVVAQPYSRASWTGLQQWAQRNHAQLTSPPIQRPAVSDDSQTIIVDPKLANDDGSGRSAWLTYSMSRAVYRDTLFHQKFPGAAQYRHTLTEEVDCLQHVIAYVKEKNIPADKLDSGLKALLALDGSHMLEPWILLNGADAGIAQDYAAYREGHREQLRSYIAQYDIVSRH